jgi:hypothetical protein
MSRNTATLIGIVGVRSSKNDQTKATACPERSEIGAIGVRTFVSLRSFLDMGSTRMRAWQEVPERIVVDSEGFSVEAQWENERLCPD